MYGVSRILDGNGVELKISLILCVRSQKIFVMSDPLLCRSPSKTRVERRTPHHASSVTAKAAILGKVGQVSRIQRAKAMVDRRKSGRKNLQRQNLAREFQGRNTVRHRNYLCQPRQRQCNHWTSFSLFTWTRALSLPRNLLSCLMGWQYRL